MGKGELEVVRPAGVTGEKQRMQVTALQLLLQRRQRLYRQFVAFCQRGNETVAAVRAEPDSIAGKEIFPVHKVYHVPPCMTGNQKTLDPDPVDVDDLIVVQQHFFIVDHLLALGQLYQCQLPEDPDWLPTYRCRNYHHLGGEGNGKFLLGVDGQEVSVKPGEVLYVPPKTLCGTKTDSGMIYTEIILKKENFTMNNIIKAGQPTELKNLISYEEGSIANLDIAHADNMKFVLMAFDEGTGLTPHRAPGNAILTALEGKAIIGYEGKDYELNAGESFRFDKNGLHSVTAQGKFKMSLLLVIE